MTNIAGNKSFFLLSTIPDQASGRLAVMTQLGSREAVRALPQQHLARCFVQGINSIPNRYEISEKFQIP